MTVAGSTQHRVAVGIGQLAISSGSDEILVAYGLGSCIGMSVYDPRTGLVGLVHVLLPSCGGKPADRSEPGRFADTGVDALFARMTEAGASTRRLVIKLAGGASVLGTDNTGKFKIGQRNADAIQERLKQYGLAPVALDIGGTQGRTLEVHSATGKTFVRTAASPATEL